MSTAVNAFGGQKDEAKLLIAKGADVDAKDKVGSTPLYLAVKWDYKDVVELLKDMERGNEAGKAGPTPALPMKGTPRRRNKASLGIMKEWRNS